MREGQEAERVVRRLGGWAEQRQCPALERGGV